MKKELNQRWEDMNVEELVDAAVNGNGNPEMIQEAKELMEETIENRDKE